MSFLSDIVKKVKGNFSDDKGFFRGNKSTPVTQMTGKPLNSYQTPTFSTSNRPSLVPTPQFPTLEAPKPSFKTNSAEKLNSRLELIKEFGTSNPKAVEAKLPKQNIWDSNLGKGLVKAQEFTKPMADNMFNSVETYKEDPTKILTEGVPKFFKGALIDNPKMAARWAWNTGQELAGKSRQDLEQQKQDEAIKQKLLWNKINTAKKYREMGDIENATRLEEEVKQGINEPNRFDKFGKDIEQRKNQLKADAVGTGMLLASAGQPLNAKNLVTAGGMSAGMGLVSGQDPFEAAGQGVANAQRWKAVTQFTNPAITKTINTFVNEKTAPVISKVTTKLISGTGNVIEDRLIDSLEGKQRGIMDDLSSFVMGAIMGNIDPKAGKFEKGDFKRTKLLTDIKTKIKADWIASGKLDPKDSEALDKVVDRIVMLGVKEDGDLTNMKGSSNLFTDEPDILDEGINKIGSNKKMYDGLTEEEMMIKESMDMERSMEDRDYYPEKNNIDYSKEILKIEEKLTPDKKVEWGNILRNSDFKNDEEYLTAIKELSQSTPISTPQNELINEARKYKSAEEFVDTNKTIKVPISDFKKTDSEGWNRAVDNVNSGKLSKTKGPIEVIMTPDGYKIIEGNHRAVQSLNSGNEMIDAVVISKEGLDKIALRDGPHIKIAGSQAFTKSQLEETFNKSQISPESGSNKFDGFGLGEVIGKKFDGKPIDYYLNKTHTNTRELESAIMSAEDQKNNKAIELLNWKYNQVVNQPIPKNLSPESKPSISTPEPKTELDWLKENNKKNNSTTKIDTLLGGRDYSKPQPIMVKGVDISSDVNKMMSEGWKPDEIDYAIKLANESKVSAPNKDWGAYVRGILKKGQPVKASGMGGKGVVKQEPPSNTELAKSDYNAELNELELENQKPVVKNEPQTSKVTTQEPKVDSRASSEVTEPKKTTEIDDMVALEKERGKKRISEMFTKTDFENTKNKYSNVEVEDLPKKIDITTDKGVDLVARIKQAKNLDKLGYNSDNAWKEIQKIESEIKTPVVETPKTTKNDNLTGSEKQVKPSVEPKVEQSTTPVKKVETTTTTEPKAEKPFESRVKDTESRHFSPEQTKKAMDFEKRVIELEKESENLGFSSQKWQSILDGESNAPKSLENKIRAISEELGREQVRQGLPEDKLMKNHISQVDLSKTDTELTSQDNFSDVVLGSTFDAHYKRKGTIEGKNLANGADAFITEYRSILRKDYIPENITNKIISENNIPVEKAPEVRKIVDEEINIRKEISTEANKRIKKGKLPKTDIIAVEAARENKINELIGNGKKRPVVKSKKTDNILVKGGDTLIDYERTEGTFFQDKTNDEIYNAYVDLRKAEKGTGDMDYGTAKRRFYNIATKYDYEDPMVQKGVNYFLNRRIATDRIIESNFNKVIRGITRQLSRSQIAGNIKVAVEQPTEVFRLAADDAYGIKKAIAAIKSSFDLKEFKRIVEEYGLEAEKSGNIPIKDIFKKTDTKDLPIGKKIVKKGFEIIDNVGYKGVAMTENWKNVVFAKAAETEGISRGLKGQDLKSFVEKELIRIGHISDKGMTPRIMDSALGAGALQYKQYSTKQDVLLWDTLTGDKTIGKKAKQIAKYKIAEWTAKATIAGITGVPAFEFAKWSTSMLMPQLGPLLTIPYNLAKNEFKYLMMDEEEREKTEKPSVAAKETLITALTPAGVQIRSKTKRVKDILESGQSLSKKGNVNYVAGEMPTWKKFQALVFGVGALPNKIEADKRWARLDKDGIYPTLTAEQSKVLMSKKTDAEKEAYYKQQMKLQTPNKDVVKARKGEKQNLIQKIFNKNEVDPNTSLVPQEGSTPEERTKFESQIKAFINDGDTSSVKDDEWNSYFFDEVNKMPESDSIEKHQKEIDRWKKITTIENNEDLDQETKDKIIANSGVSKDDLEYYKNASLDNGSKKVLLTKLSNQEDRNAVIQSLIEAKRVVGNKALATNTETDYLYDMGLISKDEKKLIDSWKYDEIKGDFYQDRDYKASGSGNAKTIMNKMETARKALFDDLEKLNKPSKKSKLIETILQMDKKKVTEPKTVGSLLESTRFAKKKVTQNNTNTGNIKSVKRIYRFKK